MHNVQLSEEQRSETEMGDGQEPSPMQKASRREVAYHMQPAPEAQPPTIDPFPPAIWRGLWLGIAIGILLGLFFGYLLFQGILPVEGWEGLFSMTPFTFHVFWAFVGAAAGLFIGGLIGIVRAPVPSSREDKD